MAAKIVEHDFNNPGRQESFFFCHLTTWPHSLIPLNKKGGLISSGINADLVVSSSLHLQRGPFPCLTAFKEIADNGDRMSAWSRGHRITRRQVVVLTQCQPWDPLPAPCAPRKGTDGTRNHRESWPGDLGSLRAIRVVQAPQHSVPPGRVQTQSQGSCVTPDPPGHCQAHLGMFHLSLLLAMEKTSSRRGTNQITGQLMKIMGNKALLEAAWLDCYFPVSLCSSRDVYNLTRTFHCLCD